MARSVNVHSLTVEIITPVDVSRTQIQDDVIHALDGAGFEVHSVESLALHEKRMPDRNVIDSPETSSQEGPGNGN